MGKRKPQHFRPQQYDSREAKRQMDAPTQSILPVIRGREIDAGDLSGEAVEQVQASFGYFGKRFRVNPDLTESLVVDLLEKGEEIEVNDPRNLIAAKDYVRGHIHADDFDEFWETVQANRQTIHAVMKLCWLLLERISDRDFTQPSGSSDGPPATPTSSPAGVSAPAIESGPAATGNVREVADHFMRKFEDEGRPDLAIQIDLARQHREEQGLVMV